MALSILDKTFLLIIYGEWWMFLHSSIKKLPLIPLRYWLADVSALECSMALGEIFTIANWMKFCNCFHLAEAMWYKNYINGTNEVWPLHNWVGLNTNMNDSFLIHLGLIYIIEQFIQMFLDSHLIKFIAWQEIPYCLQGNWKHKIIIYVM